MLLEGRTPHCHTGLHAGPIASYAALYKVARLAFKACQHTQRKGEIGGHQLHFGSDAVTAKQDHTKLFVTGTQ